MPSSKSHKPARPYTSYNLFFQLVSCPPIRAAPATCRMILLIELLLPAPRTTGERIHPPDGQRLQVADSARGCVRRERPIQLLRRAATSTLRGTRPAERLAHPGQAHKATKGPSQVTRRDTVPRNERQDIHGVEGGRRWG